MTVLTGKESIGSIGRHTLIVTLVISCKLNVEQDTLGLRSVHSDIAYCSYLGFILIPQLCKQYLGLCVINLKTAQS